MLYVFVFVLILQCFESHNSTLSSGGCENPNEMTLVTAYFEVSNVPHYRGVSRTPEAYLSYFARVARLKNDLIVYCQTDSIRIEIVEIRRNFGLENRTNVVVVGDVFSLDLFLFNEMTKISKEPYFLKFRESGKNQRGNEATYDYVVNLKAYFLNRANSEFDIKTKNVAWIDFGLDHGGDYYSHEEDWGFNLQCELSDKVTLYYVRDLLDEKPFLEVVRTFYPVIGSGFFKIPKSLINEFYTVYNNSLYTLLKFGLIDDDQAVLLLTTRLHPSLFELKRSWYCLALKQYCNGEHMRLIPESLEFQWIGKSDRAYLKAVFLEK